MAPHHVPPSCPMTVHYTAPRKTRHQLGREILPTSLSGDRTRGNQALSASTTPCSLPPREVYLVVSVLLIPVRKTRGCPALPLPGCLNSTQECDKMSSCTRSPEYLPLQMTPWVSFLLGNQNLDLMTEIGVAIQNPS